MIAPEVWSFTAPNHSIEIVTVDLNDTKEKWLKNKIFTHYFNKMISIVLPDTLETPTEVVSILSDSDYYLVKSLGLKEVIKRSFVESFIEQDDPMNVGMLKAILKENLKSSARSLRLVGNIDFQQDNGSKQTADLNPLEHLWAVLDQKIEKRAFRKASIPSQTGCCGAREKSMPTEAGKVDKKIASQKPS